MLWICKFFYIFHKLVSLPTQRSSINSIHVPSSSLASFQLPVQKELIQLKTSLVHLEKKIHCITAQKPGANRKKVVRTSGNVAKRDKDGTISFGYCEDVH